MLGATGKKKKEVLPTRKLSLEAAGGTPREAFLTVRGGVMPGAMTEFWLNTDFRSGDAVMTF